MGRPAAASLASLSTAVIFGARYGACLAGSQPPPQLQVTATADASAVDPHSNGIRVLPGRSSRPAAADDTDEEARVDFGQFGVPEGDWFEDLIPPTLRGRYVCGKLRCCSFFRPFLVSQLHATPHAPSDTLYCSAHDEVLYIAHVYAYWMMRCYM